MLNSKPHKTNIQIKKIKYTLILSWNINEHLGIVIII